MSNYLGVERDLSNIKNVQEIFFHVSKGGIPNNGVATEGGGGGGGQDGQLDFLTHQPLKGIL